MSDENRDFRKNETIAAELVSIAEEHESLAYQLREAVDALRAIDKVKDATAALAEARRRVTEPR